MPNCLCGIVLFTVLLDYYVSSHNIEGQWKLVHESINQADPGTKDQEVIIKYHKGFIANKGWLKSKGVSESQMVEVATSTKNTTDTTMTHKTSGSGTATVYGIGLTLGYEFTHQVKDVFERTESTRRASTQGSTSTSQHSGSDAFKKYEEITTKIFVPAGKWYRVYERTVIVDGGESFGGATFYDGFTKTVNVDTESDFFFIRSLANQRLVSAENSATPMKADHGFPPSNNELYIIHLEGGDRISIQSKASLKYVCVDTSNGRLIARCDWGGRYPREVFTRELSTFRRPSVLLKSTSRGRYVTADLTRDGELFANVNERDKNFNEWSIDVRNRSDWVYFMLTPSIYRDDEDRVFVTWLSNGQYVTIGNSASGLLVTGGWKGPAHRPPQDQDQFVVIDHGNNIFSFLSKLNWKFVCVKPMAFMLSPLVAETTILDMSRCSFERIILNENLVAFKTRMNGWEKFVSLDPIYGGKLMANADQIQHWEKFKLDYFHLWHWPLQLDWQVWAASRRKPKTN